MNKRYQQGFVVGKLLKFVIFLVFILYLLNKGIFNIKEKQHVTVDPVVPGIVVGFFNGVNVSFEKAKYNLQEIKDRYGVEGKATGSFIQYQLFYNDTYGFASDILETFQQRDLLVEMEQTPELFWNSGFLESDKFKKALSKKEGDIGGFRSLQMMIIDLSDKSLLKTISNRNTDTQIEQFNLVSRILNHSKKQRFILISHSQGNLYGIHAFKYIQSLGAKVSILHLAPPIDFLKGEYVLSSEDMVINRVRSFAHVKPYNIDLSGCDSERCPDMLGHGFDEIYFNTNNEAGQKMQGLMLDLLNK